MTVRISWNDFVNQVPRLAEGVLEAGFDAESHAADLAELSSRLDPEDSDLVDLFERLERNRISDYSTMGICKSKSCGIMLISLKKGCKVGLHDHPNQSGFILCYGGKVEIEAFDVENIKPPILRHAGIVELSPGANSFLTPIRRNVHSLKCPEETRLIDVFTPPLRTDLGEHCQGYSLQQELEPGLFTARKTD